MKFATRMVLIPETEYLLLKQANNPGITKKTKKLNPKTTAQDITQQLGKKIRMREQETAKIYKPSVKIIEHLPPIYQSKAKLLLSELADAGIKYTDNKELVLNTGEVISQSNIVDLIRESLVSDRRTDSPKPTGWTAFLDNVAASTVPMSMFKAQTRREIQRARTVPAWEEY